MKFDTSPRDSALIFICFTCVLCFLPGIFYVFGAHFFYSDWESSPAKIVDTTYCGEYRRRVVESKQGLADQNFFGYGEYHYGPPPDTTRTDLKPQYSVTYSFTTDVGQKITATTEYCTNPVPPLGGTDTVMYDPGNPSVRVMSERLYSKYHYLGLALTIFGLIAIVASGIFLYWLFKKKNSSSSDNTRPYNTNYNADGTHFTTTNNDTYSDNNPHDKA